MKSLKESILDQTNYTGEGFEAQRRDLIEKWLKKYNIKNYTINDDFTIDVDGDVNLADKRLKELPEYIRFRGVRGDFDCNYNNFTSLEGTPMYVYGNFNCSRNNLTSLEGAPRTVYGSFNCCLNRLTSLKGTPNGIEGDFICSNNSLVSLKGCPGEIRRSFDCSHNKLTSLKEAPKKVGGDFICNDNTTEFTMDDVKKICKVGGIIDW